MFEQQEYGNETSKLQFGRKPNLQTVSIIEIVYSFFIVKNVKKVREDNTKRHSSFSFYHFSSLNKRDIPKNILYSTSHIMTIGNIRLNDDDIRCLWVLTNDEASKRKTHRKRWWWLNACVRVTNTARSVCVWVNVLVRSGVRACLCILCDEWYTSREWKKMGEANFPPHSTESTNQNSSIAQMEKMQT